MTLSELKKLAQSATKGPWIFEPFKGGDGRDGYALISKNKEEGWGYGIAWIESMQLPRERDGKFIAAMNPSTALRMIELLERARTFARVTKTVSKESSDVDLWLKDLEEL